AHQQAGIDVTRLVAEALLDARDVLSGPVFVQSFSSEALLRLNDDYAGAWPLVQLLDNAEAARAAAEPSRLTEIADYATGIGLPYTTLIRRGANGTGVEATGLADAIAAAGLIAHPYTLRRDAAPEGAVDYFDALRFLIHELRVDGIFCDFPDDGVRIRDYSAA
ncbi:MAG: glycerophosphodiester phosphodiesterase family protein, partial [Gammaproteobacteria bacterium]|nr:glycerophosphodiester phosphodiesterase family protein [Gammaproteobacteria bacterium]